MICQCPLYSGHSVSGPGRDVDQFTALIVLFEAKKVHDSEIPGLDLTVQGADWGGWVVMGP